MPILDISYFIKVNDNKRIKGHKILVSDIYGQVAKIWLKIIKLSRTKY